MKIYTITLNPAYDIHAYTEHFAPNHENLANVTSRDAGGKGVNLSRALTSGGVRNTAVVVLGRENATDFKESLAKFGQDCLYFEKPGRIRENLTLHCGDGSETRISFSGFTVDDSILDEILDAVEVDSDTVVTFTGRVSGGISMAAVKVFLSKLRNKGARIVIDSKSFSLADLYEVRPWLIKPNQEEVSEYFCRQIHSPDQATVAAKEFAAHGIANAMVSLGQHGALLASGVGILIANAPKVTVRSTVGAGDSSIAGFLVAASWGGDAGECLKNAVAYGSAACMSEGSQPPEQENIERFLPLIHIQSIH